MRQERTKAKQNRTRSARAVLGATALLGASVLLSGCHIDMWEQPKVDVYSESDFYADKQGSRPLVAGAIAQGPAKLDDPAYYTGRDVNGKLVKTIPVRAVNAFHSPGDMLKTGQERYEAYCTPCHSRVGNGNGFIAQRGLGYWQKLPATFHTDRLRKIEDGHIYDVIVNGQGVMYSYSSRIQNVNDRWAVVAYVRALQLSRQQSPALLTADERDRLKMEEARRGASAGVTDPGATTPEGNKPVAPGVGGGLRNEEAGEPRPSAPTGPGGATPTPQASATPTAPAASPAPQGGARP
jgi:mono/diheme cytochrome c family protein